MTTVEWWNGKRRKLPGESTISHVVVVVLEHSFAFSRIHCCLFLLQLHYQGNLLKRITITQNLKEIKDVRGPATEMIISPCWQAKQLLGGWPDAVGMEHERKEGGTSAAIVAAQALFHSKKRERGCNFHLATVCFTCAVISDKRSGRKAKEGTEAPGNGRNQATRAQFTHLKFK